MAQLGAKARAQLPDAAFAYIDPRGRRLLPIHDEAHVRNALSRFSRVVFDDEDARDRARTRLLRAAKRYGIVPVGFIDAQLRPERNLPTGRVAFLLADVEDSTGHLTAIGDTYPRLIADLRRLLRTAVRDAGGHEVDARADEFFAAFREPSAALVAAVRMQRAVGAHDWTDGRRVRVRIGLHAGRPALTPSGYVGLAVNTVSRIAGAGHGGQILVSSAVRSAVELPDGVSMTSLGQHRLRGIPEAQELWQVGAAKLARAFPPPRTVPAVASGAGYRVPHRGDDV
jgi:class 3 adenylate cyclase